MSQIHGIYCNTCHTRIVLKPRQLYVTCKCPEGGTAVLVDRDGVWPDDDADYERLDPKTGKRIKK